MELRKIFFAFPLIALFAYTFGAIFLTFVPSGIYLSPGEETLSSTTTLSVSIGFLVLVIIILLAAFLQNRKEKR